MGNLYTLDQNGNVTTQAPDAGEVPSWTGNWYSDPPQSIFQVVSPQIQYASLSYAAMSGGNPAVPGVSIPTLGPIYQAAIAEAAKGHIGDSSTWKECGFRLFCKGSITCNIFVHDVLEEASDKTVLNIPAPTRPPRKKFGFITRVDSLLAAEWADPGTGGCWKVLPGGAGDALPGDVLATGWPAGGPDATGHVGIVVRPGIGSMSLGLVSAASVPPYFWSAAQKQAFVPGTITLSDYGFRLPGFDFTNPPDNQGLRVDSTVKRFTCY